MICEFRVALRFREILRCVFWRFMDEGFVSMMVEKILEGEREMVCGSLGMIVVGEMEFDD